jgi:hypothetical protein
MSQITGAGISPASLRVDVDQALITHRFAGEIVSAAANPNPDALCTRKLSARDDVTTREALPDQTWPLVDHSLNTLHAVS